MEKAIYKITNNINNKIYIGQSVHPDKRWWEHCNRARNGTDNYPIHLAISKYGKENFSFEILEWTSDYDNRERELIKKYDSLSPKGYNVAQGGNSIVLIGENHPRNTVSDSVLLQVIEDLKSNSFTDREIAKRHGLTDKIVADINHGYSHKLDNVSYPIREKRGRQKLTKDQVAEIKVLLKTTSLSYSQIATMFNVTKSNIYHINTGRTFKQSEERYPIREENINEN